VGVPFDSQDRGESGPPGLTDNGPDYCGDVPHHDGAGGALGRLAGSQIGGHVTETRGRQFSD
jgi:hypothetical protein